MIRTRPEICWPILVLLGALFCLSVQAPRSWEFIARRTALETLPGGEAADAPPVVTPREGFAEENAGPLPTDDVASPSSTAAQGYENSSPARHIAAQVVTPDDATEPARKSQDAPALPMADPAPSHVLDVAKARNVEAEDSSATSQADSSSHATAESPSQSLSQSPIAALAALTIALPSECAAPSQDADRSAESPTVANSPANGPALVGETNSGAKSGDAGITAPDEVREVKTAAAVPHSIAVEDTSEPPAKTISPAAETVRVVAQPAPKTAAEPVEVATSSLPEPAAQPLATKNVETASEPTGTTSTKPSPAENIADKSAEKLTKQVPSLNAGEAKSLARSWEEPRYLLSRIELLGQNEETRQWCSEAAQLVRRLGPALAAGDEYSVAIVDRLDKMTSEAGGMIPMLHDYQAAQELCRVGHSVDRHVIVWRQIARMGGLQAANAPAPTADPQAMHAALAQFDAMTKDSPEGPAWRNYLMTDSLRQWLDRRKTSHERIPHEMGQAMLKRLNQVALSHNQRQFLTTGPLASLHRELVRQTAEPIESNGLLHDLEVYEQTGLPSDARKLARDCQVLSVSSGTGQQQLGRSVETFYRNANLRLAVSSDLLNRMIPKREAEYESVSDNVLGVPVRGRSLVNSDVKVRMLPDAHRAVLALEVNGEVASLTRADAGPATFYTDSQATYVARKPMELTLTGIRVWPTEVDVDSNSHLRQVKTDFDHVPIAGFIARNVARSQHDEQAPAADAEVRQKIASKARDRVDTETSAQVERTAKRLRDDLLGPMDSLLLDPAVVDAETNEQRFNMRIRLAGNDQLGGYTPRPQAPSDSLASLQLHESAVNNILERLELDGNTFSPSELGLRIAQRLHRPQPKAADADQDDVRITFAAQNALHVRCNNGRIEVSLAVAKLAKGTRKWKNFQVLAYYRPDVKGRSVELMRDGVVEFPATRMSAGSQIVLRGVFSKVFSQKEGIKITPADFVNQPKLDGLSVTQFLIDDGWIGAAIGPERVAQVTTRTERR